MSSNSRNKDSNTDKRKEIIQQIVAPKPKPQLLSSNVSTATFSSMSKQAESLVNGGNSVLFNPYNNNLVFQYVAMNLNDCLSIDVINRSILNLISLKFANSGIINGISDGFTVDDKGQVVQIYDPTIALSCAFGYKIQTESDETVGRLNIEIERRQLDFETLLTKYKETDKNALHAESMIHYIDFDLVNHEMKFIIPVEDATGPLTFGDTLPAETMEYGSIVPGKYDPNVGINEIDKMNITNEEIVNVSKDGMIINGDLLVSEKLSVQQDLTMMNTNVGIAGITMSASGFQYPEFKVDVETEEGTKTISFPEMLILGIAQSFDLSVEYLVPSVSAVYQYVSALTKAMMEVIAADFEAKQQLIDLNASMIDGIKNSCGGYETETHEYSMDSKTWRLWVFIRKWIIKALRESLNNENPPEWEENLPSIADAISTSTFGPEWKKYMTLSEGGGTVDPYIKIGHEATTTRYNVCNLYVDGSTMGGILAGKDSQCGIYSYNWLVVHGYVDYKNSGIHFLCEGVAQFKDTVKFEGGVEGLDFAPSNHTHTYESITDKPEIYTKEEVDNQIKELKNQIQTLTDKVNDLLMTIKDMNTYEEVLFRLIDLTKEIMNIKTTCGNLDQRIIALEGSKGDIDAVKQNVVELQSWKTTTDETLTNLDARVTALEGA